MASRDLNYDVGIPSIFHVRWHAGERDLGMRVPATEHVGVDASRAEVWLHRQWNPCPSRTPVRAYRNKISRKSSGTWPTAAAERRHRIGVAYLTERCGPRKIRCRF